MVLLTDNVNRNYRQPATGPEQLQESDEYSGG